MNDPSEFYCIYPSPVGKLYLRANPYFLTGVDFKTHLTFDPSSLPEGKNSVSDETIGFLDIYFKGKNPSFLPPLLLPQSPFQRRVCEILLTIPYGKVMTYGEIASVLALERGIPKMSAQAVGNAVGRNPIPILIPCHRVIGAGNTLGGFSGGLSVKTYLLRSEGFTSYKMNPKER